MEGLNRLVAESFARHGFDRPVDYRRLRWSRWFRCESVHSLLFVPSKPGVFALAEEIMTFGNAHVGTAASAVQPERSSAAAAAITNLREISAGPATTTQDTAKRMLAVLQFGEDEDMAFVLDRMLSRQNPMRARLVSGRTFVRYVVIEEEAHRRSICSALNQWLISSGEKATGIGADFATSLELTATDASVARACPELQPKGPPPTDAESVGPPRKAMPDASEVQEHDPPQTPAAHLDSGASSNIHCPSPLPSGF